jgi:EAL domain-containing protein (putative c-di-GMP-specific phosphodiesterase class I)
MARGLGFHIVAEGIETEQQRDFLLGLGVDYLQGFLMSKPVAADDALVWLNKSPADWFGK